MLFWMKIEKKINCIENDCILLESDPWNNGKPNINWVLKKVISIEIIRGTNKSHIKICSKPLKRSFRNICTVRKIRRPRWKRLLLLSNPDTDNLNVGMTGNGLNSVCFCFECIPENLFWIAAHFISIWSGNRPIRCRHLFLFLVP